MTTNKDCASILRHLKRIKGQIEALESRVADGASCDEVAHLLKSLTGSFASVRASIAEEMLMRELAAGRIKPRERSLVRSIVSVLGK